jgi:hypothetical protein
MDIVYVEAPNFMLRFCLEKTVKSVFSTSWRIRDLISSSWELKSGTYESISHPLNFLLYYPYKYFLPSYISVFQIVSFFHMLPAEHIMYLSSSHACNMACLSHPLLLSHQHNTYVERNTNHEAPCYTVFYRLMSLSHSIHPHSVFKTWVSICWRWMVKFLIVKNISYNFQNHKNPTYVCFFVCVCMCK